MRVLIRFYRPTGAGAALPRHRTLGEALTRGRIVAEAMEHCLERVDAGPRLPFLRVYSAPIIRERYGAEGRHYRVVEKILEPEIRCIRIVGNGHREDGRLLKLRFVDIAVLYKKRGAVGSIVGTDGDELLVFNDAGVFLWERTRRVVCV